ncbi:outer membrane beta-barrel protein [Sphingomonas sp. PP-CE-1G-424]|uniref:outer membrane protein n=1 Tax=Sphingomonas sp. PP-CE-1G-424 TaxID=2135658 RepID=UPI0010D15A55|nr:outer membrane beta-barrel protein [Sphingomonas sp. PP-CE-1G-424]TCP72491.1 outer membrane immunogenic protein [Sphingomonas sp. PP-CE-1G-424]
MNETMKAALAGAAALGAALGLAAPAAAQETTADAPFSGVYIGGSFGYDVQPNDVGETIEFDRNLDGVFTDTISTATVANAFSPGFCNGRAVNNVAPTNGGPRCRNDKDGIAYYGRVGADIQRGNIVFGVVGEFGKSEISDSVSAFSTTPAFYTMTRDLKWEASARVRAGYAANTTLFYGTAGGGYANIDNSFTTGNTANTFTTNGDSKQWGLVGGGGIEQKLGKNFSIGLEYLFHRYKDDDYRVRASGGPAGGPFTRGNASGTDFRRNFDYFRWHSLRATAAFRF